MEQKQFSCDDLDEADSNQGFQADKFIKKTNYLNIPDTIPENCTGELSGDSLKMEAPKVIVDNINSEHKENVSLYINETAACNEDLDTSVNLVIDNSFIKHCERKLLESSISDDEKYIESDAKCIVNKNLLEVPRKSLIHEDTISTPPSILRKEISLLRNEMAEVHEFHDFEIQLLKEEKCLNEADPDSYLELFEKYSALMELYTTLKTEYDEYRKEQEKMRRELQSKTADCLESLCSQIEASDSSLNFSGASFASFNGGIKSSTMLEDITEVETTVVNDATILANDPLSITIDGVFKTPLHTPLKSAIKLLPQELSSTLNTPVVKEVSEILSNHDATFPLDSECKVQLLNLETALYEKVKEVEDLEQRLFKVEDWSSILQSEFERISGVYAKENQTLKESLSKKSEQLNELTQKLFTETISLDPSLRDTLIDAPGPKLLIRFIDTIMESCKKIQNELITKHACEKTEWISKQKENDSVVENLKTRIIDLEGTLSRAESKVLTQEDEIRMLESLLTNVKQTRDDFESARQKILELESRLTLSEAEKIAAENRYRELESVVDKLKLEIKTIEEKKWENAKSYQAQKAETEREIQKIKAEFEIEKTELQNRYIELERANQTLQEEAQKIKTMFESEKNGMQNRCIELQSNIETLKEEMRKKETELQNRNIVLEQDNQNLLDEVQKVKATFDMENTDRQNKYTELDRINQILKDEIQRAESELQKMKATLENRETEVRNRYMELELVNKNLQDELNKIRATSELENTEFQNRHIELEHLTRSLKDEIQNKEIELQKLKEKYETNETKQQNQYTELENVTRSLQEELQGKESELQKMKATFESEETELKNRHIELEHLTRSLKDEIQNKEIELQKLKEKYETNETKQQNQYTELENVTRSLQEELQGKESELQKMKATFESEETELKNRHIELERLTQSLKDEIQNKEIELKNMKDVKEGELQNLYIELGRKHQTLQEELQKKEAELQKIKSTVEMENTELQNRYIELERVHDTLKDEMRKMKASLEFKQSELQNRYTELEHITQSLQQEVQEKESKLQKMKTAFESEETELQNRYNELERANQTLQNAITNDEKIRKELKQQTLENVRVIDELKTELEQNRINAKQVEEITQQINQLQNENLDYLNTLNNVETKQRTLASLLSDVGNDHDLPSDRIAKLIQIPSEETLTRETKITSIFIETITKTCKKIQNELLEKFDEDRSKWETQRKEHEDEMTELVKVQDALKAQMAEADKIISGYKEQIIKLQSHEEILNRTKHDLNSAELLIEQLTSQLVTAQKEKTEIEENTKELKIQRNQYEVENRVLKKQMEESQTEIDELKQNLRAKESRLEELQNEIDSLQKNIRSLETQNQNLMKVLSDINSHLNMPEHVLTELLSGNIEMLSEKLEKKSSEETEDLKSRLVASQYEKEEIEKERLAVIEDLKREVEESERTRAKLSEVELLFKEACEKLQTKVKEVEDLKQDIEKTQIRLSAVEGENETLKLKIAEIKEQDDQRQNIHLALFNRLTIAEEEKIKAENQLKELVESLNKETESNLHLKESYNVLKETHEEELVKMKENLLSADETILMLKERETLTQTENNDLKKRILDSEKMTAELKYELELAKENQKQNICKVEELIREIDELKRENTGYTHMLLAIEETQKNLADVMSTPADSLPSERIDKVIANTGGPKLVSDFVETITRTCREVQNELMQKFDYEKLEWENQKGADLRNLQDKVKRLAEKNVELEQKLNEEITRLRSELSATESGKLNLEIECRKLKEANISLETEINAKETIIKGLDELKLIKREMEDENGALKKQITESEEVIIRLRKSLEIAKEEQNTKETRLIDLVREVDSLKKEQQSFESLTKKFENLEKCNKNLIDALSDLQCHLDIPEDTLVKFLSGQYENKKIFTERLNNFTKTKMEGLKIENKSLKLGNENLKDKVKQLTKLIGESAIKDELSNLNGSNITSQRSKMGRKIDLCIRRLDKLEEINHNLTECLTRILTMTGFPDVEKLKLGSVSEFPAVMKKVVSHVSGFESKLKELREENEQLDEECETYAKIIKDLENKATDVWKANEKKTEAMEEEMSRLTEQKNRLENEKAELLAKVAKLESECQKLKSGETEGFHHACFCGSESKKINELKRVILVKEQKLLELQDLEAQTNSYKSQIEYLKTALEREKKKMAEEREKTQKLQRELQEVTKNIKAENRKPEEENQVLDELRMRGSISGGIVQEFVDKEKMRKLSKDIGILKELCRARYAEIKRLEAANAALRNGTPKNSNQMDSPLRSRGYSTRSKTRGKDVWKTEMGGKENSIS